MAVLIAPVPFKQYLIATSAYVADQYGRITVTDTADQATLTALGCVPEVADDRVNPLVQYDAPLSLVRSDRYGRYAASAGVDATFMDAREISSSTFTLLMPQPFKAYDAPNGYYKSDRFGRATVSDSVDLAALIARGGLAIGGGTVTPTPPDPTGFVMPTWASLVTSVPQTLYVSNAASNGYGLGNDSAGDGTQANPYLTIVKALTVGVDGVAIQVNPSGVDYAETNGAGYFRPGATKAFFIGTPTGSFVLKPAGSAAQTMLMDASAKRMVFYGCFFDGAGTTSNRCIGGMASMTGGVEFYGGGFRNASTSAVITPTGTGTSVTFMGCAIESTVHFFMSGSGGNYALWKAWGCTFAQDNQVLHGSTTGVWTTVSIRYNNFVTNGAGTGLGFIFGGDTIGNCDFSDNVATGLFAGPIFQLVQSTTVTGTLTTSRNTGNPNKGMLYVASENVAYYEMEDCDVTAVASQTADPFRAMVLGPKARIRRNIARIFATAQVHGFALGGDGYNTDTSNNLTATTLGNLGDVTGNARRYFKMTRPALASIASNSMAATTMKLRKTGAPTGVINGYFWSDNAGVPGTLLATSPTVINAADLLTTGTGTAIETRHFMFPAHDVLTPGATYHLELRYTGTIDAANYVQIASNTTVSTGYMLASADGNTFTTDPTHQAWFELATGSFTTTDFIAEDNAVIIDLSASDTTHGFMIGAFTGPISRRNRVIGAGIAHLFKNTYNPVAYDLAGASARGFQSALYLKGVIGAKIYQSTFVQSSSTSDLAAAVSIGSNSELGVNAPISTGEMKNCVIVNNGIGSPYSIDTGGVGGFTFDYNLLYGTSSTFPVERQAYLTYPTFAAWKTGGQDVHSVYGNPLLSITSPITAADFVLPNNSLAGGVGTDVSAYVTTDFNGAAFGSPPPAGAFKLAA